MRIVIDLQSCQSGSSLGGIGRYSMELAKAMIKQSPDDEFIVLLNNRNTHSIRQIRSELQNILPQNAIRLFDVPAGCSYYGQNPLAIAAAETIRESFIESLAPDAVHLTSHFEGLGDEVVTTIPKSGPPVAVTLYDLIPYAQQKTYLTEKVATAHYFNKFNQLPNARALLAISQFSADEGRQYIQGATGLIVNIRGGVDEKFRKLPEQVTAGVTARFNTGPKFLLYTASFDARKNHARLIRAFASLPSHVRNGHKLVMIGNGWSGIYDELKRIATSQGVSESDIIFTGRVDDGDLVALYNRCSLFVFPPLWEGLGLPPLEAMACGAPAIGSNTTSLAEVIGMPEAQFDPTDVSAIANVMTRALTEPEFMARLRAHGARHHQEFTWENSAKVAMAAIRKMVAANPPERNQPAETAIRKLATSIRHLPRPDPGQLTELSYCLAANELESGRPVAGLADRLIGWVTPWDAGSPLAMRAQNLIMRLDDGVKIFAPLTSGSVANPEANVERCWTAGPIGDLSALDRSTDAAQVTDIVIMFDFGLYGAAALSAFVTTQVTKGRRVYLIVQSALDTNLEPDRQSLSAFAQVFVQASGVFVSTAADLDRLSAVGISHNVIFLPIGVPAAARMDTKSPVLSVLIEPEASGSVEIAVTAFGLLRQREQHLRLSLINATPQPPSERAASKITGMLSAAGLSNEAEATLNPVSDAALIEKLSASRLILVASSLSSTAGRASARLAAASGPPVALPQAFADEIGEAAFAVHFSSADELAQDLAHIMQDIESHALDASRVAAAARAWRSCNSLDQVAAYFQRIIRQKAASEGWEIQPIPAIDALPRSPTAVFERGVLRNSGAPGVLCHGPYIKLASGLYRVIATGKASGTVPVSGHLKITSDCGGTILKTVELRPDKVPLADTTVSLSAPAVDFEVTFSAEAGADLNLNGYQLLRLVSRG